MISIPEIIQNVNTLKADSVDLSNMLALSGNIMQANTQKIAYLVRGSQTGQMAVGALNIAFQSVVDAAASILTLSRKCDECIKNLSK